MSLADHGVMYPPGWQQCAAITRKGVRCRRLVSEGWEYCGSHRHLREKP